jgi:hypothetical protein
VINFELATVLSGPFKGETVCILSGAGALYQCELSMKDDETPGDIVTLSESELHFWTPVTKVDPKCPGNPAYINHEEIRELEIQGLRPISYAI